MEDHSHRYPKVSVLMSVYKNEVPANLEASLESLKNQVYPPAEIVIVKDGDIPAGLEAVINRFTAEGINIRQYSLDRQKGLGVALRLGLTMCSHDLVARMDSDDIALPNRFRDQVEFMLSHPDVAACGGHIEEFGLVPGDLGKLKKAVTGEERIKRYARFRNPMNHPTVLFRKEAVMEAGSYMEMPLFEDYYLWLRLMKKGYRLENMDQKLLYFRLGRMVQRRHGWDYFRKELRFFQRLKDDKIVNTGQYWLLLATRLPFRILPLKVLSFVYDKFLRVNDKAALPI